MTISKIKNIKGVDNGLKLPGNRKHPGQNANFVEDQYKRVQVFNEGKGVDFPDYEAELKTRMVHSKSAHTAGRMTTKDIINTPYKESLVFKKLLRQQRVKLNDDFEEVVGQSFYDFSDPDIQKQFEYAYECGRNEIRQGMADKRNTKTYGWGLFEKEKKGTVEQWAFRITDLGMKKAEAMAKQTYNKLFEEV